MFTHSGIDIAASPGQEVLSPVSGVVSFVGAVPSGDSLLDGAGSGQTMDAVSVRMDDGRTVTLMPVASMSVRSGQSVREGDAVGTLAATGDRSSSATHLHMGLKRGRTYYDPMTLFGAVSQTAAAERGEEAASAAAEASPEDLSAEPQWESVAETTPVAADVAEGVPESARISSGAVQWEPAPDQERSPLSVFAGAAAAFVDACRLQATAFGEGLRSLATTLHMPQAVLALLLGLVATILTAAAMRGIVLLVSRRRALPAAICQLVLVQERRR